jgi:hypothetical protein
MSDLLSRRLNGYTRLKLGITITLLGLLIYALGADPALFGLDRSPIIGILQIIVFLTGLGIICLGGYLTLGGIWARQEKSIAADIGLRLIGTGYVISFGSGMADIFGFGTHLPPLIPYLGPWQAMGVLAGEIVIALGFILMIPFRSSDKAD